MGIIDGLGFISFGVGDLDRAIDFSREVLRLELVERNAETAYLSGDQSHHWLRLERGDTRGLIRLGFRVSGEQALEEASTRLAESDATVQQKAGSETSFLGNSLIFKDPQGMEVELFDRMVERPRSEADPEAAFDLLLHAVVNVPDPVNAARFYQDVLGFKTSDQIGELVVFLRAGNRYHHSLAFGRGPGPALDHFAIHLTSLDAVMRFRNHAIRTGTLSDDVVRHAASGSVSVYLRFEDENLGVEFCSGHARIEDDNYRGRLLRPGPTTVNMWAVPFSTEAWDVKSGDAPGSHGGTEAARVAANAKP